MTILVVAIVVVTSVVLFVLGLVAPRKSRKAERKVDEALFTGEAKSHEAPGRLPTKAMLKSLKESRKLADKSADAGRSTRRRVASKSSAARRHRSVPPNPPRSAQAFARGRRRAAN